MWGTGLYRLSQVSFAWTPLTSGQVPDPSTWNYLTSITPFESITNALPKDAAQLLALDRVRSAIATSVSDAGEISVAWIPGLNRWLLLVTSRSNHSTNFGFVAEQPWGPWTVVQIFEPGVDAVFDVVVDNAGNLVRHSGPTAAATWLRVHLWLW